MYLISILSVTCCVCWWMCARKYANWFFHNLIRRKCVTRLTKNLFFSCTASVCIYVPHNKFMLAGAYCMCIFNAGRAVKTECATPGGMKKAAHRLKRANSNKEPLLIFPYLICSHTSNLSLYSQGWTLYFFLPHQTSIDAQNTIYLPSYQVAFMSATREHDFLLYGNKYLIVWAAEATAPNDICINA